MEKYKLISAISFVFPTNPPSVFFSLIDLVDVFCTNVAKFRTDLDDSYNYTLGVQSVIALTL